MNRIFLYIFIGCMSVACAQTPDKSNEKNESRIGFTKQLQDKKTSTKKANKA